MPKRLDKSNAESRFRSHGFRPLSKPEKPPRMAEDISKLSSPALGDLLSRYAAWREYTESLVSFAVAEYTRLSENYDFEYSKAWLTLPKSDTIKAREYSLTSDNKLHKMRMELLEAEMYKDMLSDKVNSYTNVITTVSREITRREGDNDRMFKRGS